VNTVRVQDTATARELFEQAAEEPVLLREGGGRAFVLMEVNEDDAETLALGDNAHLRRGRFIQGPGASPSDTLA
jgi:hypothetical protein